MASLSSKTPSHGSPFSKGKERARKSAAIRAAASRRFNTYGIKGTRLEDISSDLGLTKTGITYYYASKDELAEAVFLSAIEFLEDAIGAARETDADSADKILRLFSAFSGQLGDALAGQRSFPAQIKELELLPEEAVARISLRLNSAIQDVFELVQKWMTETGQTVRRAEPIVFYLFSLLDWLKISADKLSSVDFKLASEGVLDVLREGLAKPGAVERRLSARFQTPDDIPQIFDREARNRIKREAFIKAGIRYFNLYGFDGVALSDVAGSLGVTRGAFYYHIPDKESFLDQCFDYSVEAIEAVLDHTEADCAGLALIHHFLFDLIYTQASGVTPVIRMELMTALPGARRNRYTARLRNIARRIGDAFDMAVNQGQAHEHNPSTVEAILEGVMFLNGGYTLAAASILNDWRMSENPQSAANDYLHVLLHGLKADAL